MLEDEVTILDHPVVMDGNVNDRRDRVLEATAVESDERHGHRTQGPSGFDR